MVKSCAADAQKQLASLQAPSRSCIRCKRVRQHCGYIADDLGRSENVSFLMNGLHATLVHRGVFDEILWARFPPDYFHDAIDRLNSFRSSKNGCMRRRALKSALFGNF
eukprot:6173064-Pleurochrysis_carterae.AAC.1